MYPEPAKEAKVHEPVQEIILATFEEVGTLRARPVLRSDYAQLDIYFEV